jgi:hypothetical protein
VKDMRWAACRTRLKSSKSCDRRACGGASNPGAVLAAHPWSLLFLTTTRGDVIENNMEAVLIEKSRTAVSDMAFFETVLWHVPTPVPGSSHHFKYRLALIVNGECVMRYDNERGKGDHRHVGDLEEPIKFTTLEALFDAFQADMERILA